MPKIPPFAGRSAARLLWLTILTGFLLLAGCTTPPERAESPPERVVDAQAVDPWRRDLATFERELPERHYDLFHQLDREQFLRMVAELNRKAPTLTAEEFDFELRKILAAVGDSHTNLEWRPAEILPIELSNFAEGVFVTAARQEEIDALGMRLVAVDDLPIQDVRNRFATIIPHENEPFLRRVFPIYLRSPRFLQLLGVTPEAEEVLFTFADYQGDRFSVPLAPVSTEEAQEYIHVTNRLGYTRKNAPLYLLNSNEPYWLEHDPSRELLYLGYNSCQEDPDYPVAELVSDIVTLLEEERISTFVVDLRRNGGGNSEVLRPLIDRLVDDAAEGRAYELYTFIGPGTYSSAVLNAVDLEKYALATLVGGRTGGRPNHFGEVRSFELSNLGRKVSYSTKYFESYEGDAATQGSIRPDIEAPMSFQGLVQKRDPAMAAIGM